MLLDFPSSSTGKESACNAGDLGSIPGLGRTPGGGHGNSLQYFCLENPRERNLVGYSPWGHKESNTTEGLSAVLLLFTYLYRLYIKKKKKIARLQNIFSYSPQCILFCSCFLRFLFLSGKALSEIFPVLCAQSHSHVQLFMGYSPPGFSVHEILQARILE